MFQPSYGGTVGEKALGAPMRIAESFFKSFSPSALAQEARRQDPIQRKTPFNDGLIPDVKAYFNHVRQAYRSRCRRIRQHSV